MTKAPSAKVHKTSGQGVSRLSYQKGYALGNKGTGDSGPSASVKLDRSESDSSPRSFRAGKIDGARGMNVSYGDTIPLGTLDVIMDAGKRKPLKTPGFLKLGKPHKYKAGKDDAGFLKQKDKRDADRS